MTAGFWALLLLVLLVLGFLYFLRTPRKLQTLGDPNNRSMITRTAKHYEAKPLIDEAETPGGPHDRAERSVEKINQTGPPER